MFITICVIAYNEEQTLPAILKDVVIFPDLFCPHFIGKVCPLS